MFKTLVLLLTSFSLFGTLSLEEKVGQLLMVHFHGEVANEEAQILIQECKVGGFIYYEWANGLYSPQQVQLLSLSLQHLTLPNPNAIPLFIAVDQEGGRVARLKNGFTAFPSNEIVAHSKDPLKAKNIAHTFGKELKEVGINVNFAPVIDVNSNPNNPIIGSRAFSSDPETVILFGQRALEGYREAHIIPTLKHFPGHGDVDRDSHHSLPLVNKTLEELTKIELAPFIALHPFTDMIMTGHLLVPSLDPHHCTTFSKPSLDYLKNVIGYQGMIITDSLVMKGALTSLTVDEAAIQAVNAGYDLILLGGKQLNQKEGDFELTLEDVRRIHQSLVDAVKQGKVSESRVDEAVEKILKLKSKLKTNFPLDQLANQIWKTECGGQATRVTHWNEGENFPSLGIGHFIWYPASHQDPFEATFPALLHFIKKQGKPLPRWLTEMTGSPWKTRTEFYQDFHSEKMEELRQFLLDTQDLQALFIAQRLFLLFPDLINRSKGAVIAPLAQLTKDYQGLYALIDYLHFKGSGLLPSETYQKQGWGLLQVLEHMPSLSQQPLLDFIAAAEQVLKERVLNSPPERNEKRWLAGWLNRIKNYVPITH